MYALNSVLIATLLFVFILLANEAGVRLGIRFRNQSDDDVKSQTTAIQGGIIGMLALILGFSFNMSLSRYDSRAGAEVAEANAIGTAQLRTSLLPEPYDQQAKQLLAEYIDLRLTINHTDLTELTARRALNQETSELQQRIWNLGIEAAEDHPNPVITGYFVTAINDMIDAQGYRNDQLQRHIPPSIFYLLFIIFVATSMLTGYAGGLGRYRQRMPGFVLSFLICLLVFIIIDLDRPRRGIIQVKQDSMEALRG